MRRWLSQGRPKSETMALTGTGIQGMSVKAAYKQGDLRTKADHTEFEGREGTT